MDDGKKCRLEKGLVWEIYKASENFKCFKAMITHCVIHHQELNEKYSNLSHSWIGSVTSEIHSLSWS